MQLTIQLTPDQLRELASEVAKIGAAPTTRNQWLTISDVAGVLRCGQSTVKRQIKAGTIRATKLDGLIRISSSEVERITGQKL